MPDSIDQIRNRNFCGGVGLVMSSPALNGVLDGLREVVAAFATRLRTLVAQPVGQYLYHVPTANLRFFV